MNPVSILCIVYLGITFCWSLIEKLTDWTGTISYYQNHFRNSLIANQVRSAVMLVVFLELFCVFTLFYGIYVYFSYDRLFWIEFGLISNAITLIVLMIGQRLAKDYAGASSITVYFLVSLLGLWSLQ